LRTAARIQAIVACLALLFLAASAARGETPIATLTAPTPISGGGGWIVWSAPTAGGWTLDGWHAGTTRVLALARRPQPFDASVGSDARGRPVVTFSRCRRTPKLYPFGTETEGGTLLLPGSGAGCRLRLFELDSGHERALAVPHPAGTSDTTPSMSHGVLVFARHARAHGETWQVLLWSPRHRRRLTVLPHGAVPPCRAGCGGEGSGGDVEALAFRGSTVAFVWSPSGPGLSGEEAWEDRVDRLGRRGRLVGAQLGVESCTGEGAAIEETFPLTPLAAPEPLFPFYERGGCYTLFGTGFDVESGGSLLTGSLDRPLWGLANDGSGYFGLLAQRPASAVEAVCSTATPCTLERLTLPKLRRVHRAPTHPFI
jgi:hypothetical protein